MNPEANGTQQVTTANLPAPLEASPPPMIREPVLDGRAPAPDSSAEPDRADRARRRRSDRQLAQADHVMKTRVKHPDGGERTAADTQADEDDQRERINQEREEGSRKHDRLPRWQREIPKFVLVFDFVLLLYFFAGITNVYWQSPLSMNLAFAIALAAMVTVLSYGFLAFTGHRWRSQKDDRGLPAFDEVDGLTKAASVAAMAVIGVLAVLMYLRMHTEVIDALGTQAAQTALVIPLAVAVVSAVANFLVVGIHAVDGSDEVHRMEKLAAATRRPSRRAHQLRQRAAQQAHR